MKKYLFVFSVFFLLIACSRSSETFEHDENLTSKNHIEKFTIIPYGSSITTAKEIFEENNLRIISERGVLSDNVIVNTITIEGYFHNERCEISFIFRDGIFTNGRYYFSDHDRLLGYTKGFTEQIKNKLIEKFTEEYGKEPVEKVSGFEWELDNKIIVSLIVGYGFLSVGFNGEKYIMGK